MAESTALLRLEGVSKRFVTGDGATPLDVLRNVSVAIARGESVAIVGPSGSGKSTLLNLLGSLDRPDAGRLWFEDVDVGTLDARQLAALRNRRIGFVFQAAHLLPHCTVLENVLVPLLATEASTLPEDVTRARRLLDRVGLGGRLDHRPGQLSGGERQRTAVVRALINRPPLLLADEPTGALDRTSAQELARLLVELNREENVTLVVVTHARELAVQMGRVLELRDGQLQPAAGTPA